MSLISDIFPSSSELTNLSFGSAIPLVYRPRLLLLGDEGGLDHLGPAILHELEKFPIHLLRDPCLLSYPGAKTPEEALVHIFSEARRTTPSILYIRMFNNWWENAHEQLWAVFLTLYEKLPSNLPIYLLHLMWNYLKWKSSQYLTIDLCKFLFMEQQKKVTHGLVTQFLRLQTFSFIYTVDKPSREDRSLFFDHLIEAALSVISGLNDRSDGLPRFQKHLLV